MSEKTLAQRILDLCEAIAADIKSLFKITTKLDNDFKIILETIKPSNLISKDTDNTLTLGSDNKLKATGGSSKPTITTLNRKASQYFKFVGQYDLGEGKFIPVYELAISKFIDASSEHMSKAYTLMEGDNLTIEITMSRIEGEGVLVASVITELHSLSDAVNTYLQVSGNKLIIHLSHVGEYLSTQQNRAVSGQIYLYGEQLLSTITINYNLMSPKALLESLTEYFTVESFTDYFNIAFDNWDLGGSQLPDGISYLDIQLHGIQFTRDTTMFGTRGMNTSFHGLTSNELKNTAPVTNDAYTGSLTGITVTWDDASMHIPATQK